MTRHDHTSLEGPDATATEPSATATEPAATAFALPHGTSLGGVTTWSLEMARQVAARTSRRAILLEHPTDFRELVDVRALDDVEVVDGGVLGHKGVTAVNLAAYDGCLPAVFVPNFNPGTYATCAALSRRSPDQMRVIGYCHTDHGYYFDLLQQYEPIINRFVGVSSECADRLLELLPHRAADVVMRPYGVAVPARLERSYSPPEEPIELLYAGRLDEIQKCVSTLLRLAREMTRQGVDYRLRIVGDGPDSAGLVAKLAALEARTRERVTIQPGVPPEQMPALLRASDIAVLVSAYEGTSIFMLEALAQGCVPVVTRVSGAADVIERNVNGTYFEIGDLVGMASEIGRLDADRERLTRLGRQAYRSAAAYSDEAYFHWFHTLCEEVWHDAPRRWPADRALTTSRTTLRHRVAAHVPWARPVYRWIKRKTTSKLEVTGIRIRARTTHRPERFRIFFIRGYMRSGTNWICNLANLHPEILAAGEFHLNRVRREFDDILDRSSPVATRLTAPATRDAFESWIRLCIVSGIAWEDKTSAVWLGDRTPTTLEPVLIDGAPSILVIRDGRDVLVSRTYHFLRRNGFGTYPFERLPRMREKRDLFLEDPSYFLSRPDELLDDERWVRSTARQWAQQVTADRRTLNQVDRGRLKVPVLVLRYEDLHRDIQGGREKIYEFLGVDPARARPLDDLTRPGFTTEDVRSHYRKGSVGDWRKYFTPTVARWYHEEAGEQLVEEGYESDHDWCGAL